jgi:predicted component of type VI protein secretion system
MDVKLVVERGSSRTRFVCLRKPLTLVGRHQSCGLRIPSAQVSRHHCQFTIEDDLLFLQDLGSVNGSFLNGLPVRGKRPVRPGDRVEIGPVVFAAQYHLTPAAQERLVREDAASSRGGVIRAVALDEDGATELIEALPADDDLDSLESALPVDEEPVRQVKARNVPDAGEEEDLELALDDEDWRLPQGADLRNLLSQMEDS